MLEMIIEEKRINSYITGTKITLIFKYYNYNKGNGKFTKYVIIYNEFVFACTNYFYKG